MWTGFIGAAERSAAPYEYNPALSQQLLDEAGRNPSNVISVSGRVRKMRWFRSNPAGTVLIYYPRYLTVPPVPGIKCHRKTWDWPRPADRAIAAAD
jgi:hypothetical protein